MDKTEKPALKLVGDAAPPGSGGAGALLGQIYRSSREQLVRFLMLQTGSAVEAEDIAQTAYVKLFSKAEELSDANLRSLLFITARNLALDLRRQRSRRDKVVRDFGGDAEPIGQIASLDPDAERSMIAREHVQMIGDLIAELPPKCRYAFVAYKFEERDYRDIAMEMGVSESMVRKYVIRAISHCASRFEELEGWE